MGNHPQAMNFEYGINSNLRKHSIVVTSKSFYNMYQRKQFCWNGPASKSPERELVNEGGVLFTVFAAFSCKGLLKIALRTNLKKGKKSLNPFKVFLGELAEELTTSDVNLILSQNFYKKIDEEGRRLLLDYGIYPWIL